MEESNKRFLRMRHQTHPIRGEQLAIPLERPRFSLSPSSVCAGVTSSMGNFPVVSRDSRRLFWDQQRNWLARARRHDVHVFSRTMRQSWLKAATWAGQNRRVGYGYGLMEMPDRSLTAVGNRAERGPCHTRLINDRPTMAPYDIHVLTLRRRDVFLCLRRADSAFE